MEFKLSDECISTLTKNERIIMDYICQNMQVIPLMSIQDIAKKTHVSESTISRFPKHIGFSNFKEMKHYIAQNNASPATKISSTLIKEDSINHYLKRQNIYIDKTLEHFNMDEFQEVVHHILKASTIYIHAKGASLCLAELLAFRLRRFQMKVVIMPSSGSEIFEVLPAITEDDFVILFGFQKTPIEAQIIMEYCQKRKCKTVLMTSRLIRDMKNSADYHIYVYRGENHEYHSMTVPVAFIDALIIEIAKTGGQKYMDAIQEIYELKEQYKTKSIIFKQSRSDHILLLD